MKQYDVTGMSCAACSARVEKAVNGVEGVTSCAVSLLTNSMGVEGTASPEAIIRAVEAAGYGCREKGAAKKSVDHAAEEEALQDRETPILRKRLLWSLGFLLVLMYFSMGHHMWGWPIPAWFEGNHVAMGLVQMILAAIVMLINKKFFVSGFTSLLHGAPNMDTLVAMGSGVSFAYSLAVLFLMTDAAAKGDGERTMALMNEFYFESAAMILTLITVGKMLEARSKGKTTDALRSLMKLAPKTAVVVRDGQEAVEMFKKRGPYHYQAILMDLMMPLLDGRAAARAIRESDCADAAEIPIIALTADTYDNMEEKCLEAGMDGHLNKPVDTEELFRVLAKEFDRD